MVCQECHMMLLRDDEYHPYAACLLHKSGMDGDQVRDTLREIMSKHDEYYDTLARSREIERWAKHANGC